MMLCRTIAEDEKLTAALSKKERDDRLQQVTQQALRLHRLLSGLLLLPPLLSAQAQAPIRLWLGYLEKIIYDETEVSPRPGPTRPGEGQRTAPRQKGSLPPGLFWIK